MMVAAAEKSAAATPEEFDASRAANSADLAWNAAEGSVPQPMRLERGPFAGCAMALGTKAARAMIKELKRAMLRLVRGYLTATLI